MKWPRIGGSDDSGMKVAEVVFCSFCKKSQHLVTKVIAGPNVWICDECVQLCNEILVEEKEEEGQTSIAPAPIPAPTPSWLYDRLSERVIGQEEAKRDLAVAVYRHHVRTEQRRRGVTTIDKANVLLIGPTGSGKTLLAKALAEILSVPLALVDATTYTEAGYVGDDVETMFKQLTKVAKGSRDEAERGIIFIDEIDKIGRKAVNPSITRDVSGEGVQQALLNILGGAEVTYDPNANRKNPSGDRAGINTDGILFICAGSFEGLDRVVLDRLARADPATSRALSPEEVLGKVNQEDLVHFGFMPEFAARFGTISVLGGLTHEHIVSIIKRTPQSPVRQYEFLLSALGCSLTITDDAVEALADRAGRERVGARGLARVMDRVMRDVLFMLPDRPEVASCLIDGDVVAGRRLPRLVDTAGRPVAVKRDRVFISYSRKDSAWLNELTTTLNPLIRSKAINVWYDQEIKPSQVWRQEIADAVASTSVAVLLVTADFLESDFINSEELPYFLDAAKKERVKILWVLVSECAYAQTPIVEFQAAHDVREPIATLPLDRRQVVWWGISAKIKEAATGH